MKREPILLMSYIFLALIPYTSISIADEFTDYSFPIITSQSLQSAYLYNVNNTKYNSENGFFISRKISKNYTVGLNYTETNAGNNFSKNKSYSNLWFKLRLAF
jgi:putative IMPACT (imprinted ancient) family translation regulator